MFTELVEQLELEGQGVHGHSLAMMRVVGSGARLPRALESRELKRLSERGLRKSMKIEWKSVCSKDCDETW